jgi:hypothetical protein
MAHLDPDQLIGRLAGARLGRVPAPAGEVCPDAEALAAYADGGLSADEVARLEAHLAGCADCRRLVAALMPEPAAGAAAEPAPAGAVVLPFRQRRVVVWMSMAAGLLAAVTLWSVSRLSEPSEVMHVASAPADTAAVPPPPAAAAPERGAGAGAAPAGDARLETAPARRPPPVADAPAAARRDRKPESTGGGAEAKKLADAAAAESLDERVAQVTSQRSMAAQTNTVVAGLSRPRGPLNQQAASAADQAQNVAVGAPAPAPAAPEPSPRPAPSRAASAPPPPPPAASPAAGEPRAESTIVTGEAAGRERASADRRLAKAEPAVGGARPREADAPSPATAAPGPAAGARAAFSVAGATSAVSPAFAEPDGRLQWRIAGGRRIESSSDGGATWRPRYPSPVRLHAGSAPAIDAAWAVGDGGLVLRFTVPGEWAAVTRPADVALVGVTASSASAARVTAADGRVFETTDGGRTWSEAAPR